MTTNFKVKRIKLSKPKYEELCYKIFEKQDWQCAICNQVKPLQADHIIKRSQMGGDTEDNLRGLCLDCHDEQDNRGGKSKKNKKVE